MKLKRKDPARKVDFALSDSIKLREMILFELYFIFFNRLDGKLIDELTTSHPTSDPRGLSEFLKPTRTLYLVWQWMTIYSQSTEACSLDKWNLGRSWQNHE